VDLASMTWSGWDEGILGAVRTRFLLRDEPVVVV